MPQVPHAMPPEEVLCPSSLHREREAQCAGFSLLPQKSGKQETLGSEEAAALRLAMIPGLARAQDPEQMWGT